MVVRTRFRRAMMLLAFHTIVLGASGFFAWHAYTGERGIIARREHKVRIAQLNRQLEELKIERMAHERRVSELAYDELDRDLLDERARVILNLAHRNDLVILTGK
ncbi:MAG TPA: septum formation initiator family protein [Beijerinckiaceae bacterium]|nr:septum formation initiator family protein [Beijerinckiaceae bacterium]